MNLRQEILLIVLSLVLSSCSGKSEGWTSGKIASTSIICSHLTFPAKNIYRNLEIYLQRDGEQINVFLNIFCTPFESDDEGMVLVTFTISEEEFSFKAHALAGNQRLLLPFEAKELLLNTLNAKQNVIISAGKYSNEVTSESFQESFLQF